MPLEVQFALRRDSYASISSYALHNHLARNNLCVEYREVRLVGDDANEVSVSEYHVLQRLDVPRENEKRVCNMGVKLRIFEVQLRICNPEEKQRDVPKKERRTVSEFMNGEDISNAWLPVMRYSLDLRSLRTRMIKLLNLPWNPPPAMKRGMVKERKTEVGEIAVLVRSAEVL
ncbi:hypothetical protein ALC62_12863 [Cyphomyrmex costatus]|uniref:Uncharacterized protein n=1 Tax=Cyphomyrmex costatus TaxID=456900 RepID=A0A195C8J5_9HYME|nr:hypothetical protein ALC62_12863 [Cyphomyrmex costatus]